MRLLFITPRLPYPPLKGDSLRSYYFIKQLAAEHEIDLISFVDDGTDPAHVAEMRKLCLKVETVRLRPALAAIKAVAGILRLAPLQVLYYSSRQMHAAMKRAIANEKYDAVHVCLARMMPYAKWFGRVPVTLDFVDALSLNMKRRSEKERNPVKKLVFFLEHLKMRRYEKKASRVADQTVVTSPADAAALPSPVRVVPNGVDTGRFSPRGLAKDIDAVFTGNMNYFPNETAAENYARRILPLVLDKKPNANFFVVGANPSKRVRRLANGRNVVVTGVVEDMSEYLNRSKVFVAPLEAGSGIQNKILEAMSCGVPVVSTAAGNVAIGATPGRDIIVSDEPAAFSACVLSLLASQEDREAIGANGRRHVEANFSWPVMAERLVEAYRRARTLHRLRHYEDCTGRVPVETYATDKVLREHGAILMRLRKSRIGAAIDVLLALIGLTFAAPILIFIAALIMLKDGRPAFFGQRRVGRDGKVFTLWKYRTMIKNAETATGAVFCKDRDPRITPLGRFLRKTRLDELPQLFNVLKGDMGLIGPRPERPEFVKDYARMIPLYGHRHAIKPGLTGWAQVNFPYASTIEDTIRKLQYDLYYVKNRSPLLNLNILLLTVSVVFTGRGAR